MEAPGAALPPEEQRAAQLLGRALDCTVVPHPERTMAKRPDLRAHLAPDEWADIEVTRDLSEMAPSSSDAPGLGVPAPPWPPTRAEAIPLWCSRLLSSDKYSDIAQKFTDSTARHFWAFIYATASPTHDGDSWIAAALESGIVIPHDAPMLPDPLTGVWIAARERVIWWTVADGWNDSAVADDGGMGASEHSGRVESS
ncbi:MAG: hypothetical protein WDZ57_00520 [Demequina sp.]